jgi:hypothetical protein
VPGGGASTVWNSELWLLVRQAAQAPVLWRSDGTPQGTRQAADLCADLGVCGFAQYSSVGFAGTAAAGDARARRHRAQRQLPQG